MQGIEFETDKSLDMITPRGPVSPKKGAILKLMAKLGIDDIVTANYILFGISVILIGVTIFLYAGLLAKSKIDPAAEAQAILIMQKGF